VLVKADLDKHQSPGTRAPCWFTLKPHSQIGHMLSMDARFSVRLGKTRDQRPRLQGSWDIFSCGENRLRALAEYLIRLDLQFVDGYLSARMGLHMRIQAVEFFDAGFPRGLCLYCGAEFLEVRPDPIQRKTRFAMRAINAVH
jgi:hypothetical protein